MGEDSTAKPNGFPAFYGALDVVKGGWIGYAAFTQIDYTEQVWQGEDQFIAHAMPLDVANSGPTPEASRQAVDEAVRLLLATAAEHGMLTEALEDAKVR